MVRQYFAFNYLTIGRCPKSEEEETVDIKLISNTDGGELKRDLKNATVVGVDEPEKQMC